MAGLLPTKGLVLLGTLFAVYASKNAFMDSDSRASGVDEDTIRVTEAISFNTLITKFEENMDPRAEIGDRSLKSKLKEMLYDFTHPYDDRYHNQYTRYTRMCRHLLRNDHVTNRVKRATGKLPTLLKDMHSACHDFLNNQTTGHLDRLSDLDGEIMKQIICLERGVVVGLKSECESRLRVGRSVMMEDEMAPLSDDVALPTAEEVINFNNQLLDYCHQKSNYDLHGIRRSASPVTDFTSDSLDYLNCMCNNETTCGHLAQKAALSFGNDIGSVMTEELKKTLDKGHQIEKILEAELKTEKDHMVTPGNFTYEEMTHKVQTLLSLPENHRVKRFTRPDVVEIPFADFGVFGCSILIHKDIPVQTFVCTIYEVIALELTFDWTNGLPWIEIVIKLCLPVVSDILDMIGKNFRPLASLLSQFDIEAGCFVVAKAYVDFYRGVFEIYSNVPQLSLLIVRAKLRSSFLVRFDPSRPLDNTEERNELNMYGYRKFMRLHVTFNAEYFEIWNLFWGSWRCIYCTTLLERKWPLGDDQSPLLTDADPNPPPPVLRMVQSHVEGTGRVEIKILGEWGTICDDGFDIMEGDLFCTILGYRGFLGIWNETEPGEGPIHISGLNCAGTEKEIMDCPKTKDIGNTGCIHNEDIGIRCLTANTVCSEGFLFDYDMGRDQLSYSSGSIQDLVFLHSRGGWAAGSAGEGWIMVDLWFTIRVSGVRTQGHAIHKLWTTKYRIEFSKDGKIWTARNDSAGNEIMYLGNVDQNSIRSHFWYPYVPTRFVKMTAVKYHNKPALRFEVHGCTGTSGLMKFADVFQSSTQFGGFAKLAIDGKASNNFKIGKSCSYTMEEINPWWAVDVGREMVLEGLRILNRGDCCGPRLANFQIDVGNQISSSYGVVGEICHIHYGPVETNKRRILRCQGNPKGRFVQVKKRGYGILTLCEITLWASPATPTCDFEGPKVECGHSNEDDCSAEGCCWKDGGNPQCFTFNTVKHEQAEACASSLYTPDVKVTTSSHVSEGGDYSYLRSRLDTKLNPDGANNGANYQHGGWCAAINDKHQFIQLKFPDTWTVRKIITQGADQSEDFVTKYLLYYSNDGIYWSTNGGVLRGNIDASAYATNEFIRFTAKFIRLNPIEWHGRICMRFDILGCKVCEVSLVQKSPAVLLSASTWLGYKDSYSPLRARLDTQEDLHSDPWLQGGWTPQGTGIGEFIQANFMGKRYIHAVVTQGSAHMSEWVKRYSVEYSLDMEKYISAGDFEGNTNNYEKVFNYLKKSITVRSIRLKIIEYFGRATLRFDLLGCDPKAKIGIVEAAKENGISGIMTPAFFYVGDRVTFSEAEKKCKAFWSRLATPLDMISAIKGGYEICSDGWVSNRKIKRPQQHYTGYERCGDPGDNDSGTATDHTLAGVFCVRLAAYVFPYMENKCNPENGGRTACWKLGGLLFRQVDEDELIADGYRSCLPAWMMSIDDKPKPLPVGCSSSYIRSCENNVLCAMPDMISGISPAVILPFQRVQVDRRSVTISRNGAVYLPDLQRRQYWFGSVVLMEGGLQQFKLTVIGEEPTAGGVYSPSENFERVVGSTKSPGYSYYTAVCPEGYVSLGDMLVTEHEKAKYFSRFRCVSRDFVKECSFHDLDQMTDGMAGLFRVKPLPGLPGFTGGFFRIKTSNRRITSYCLSRAHTFEVDPYMWYYIKPN